MAEVYNSQLDAFDLYHLYAERAQETSLLGGPALPALGHALAGAAGSAISNTAVYPLDLIITRLQIQRQRREQGDGAAAEQYASIADAAHKIYTQEGGVKALYTGVREDTAKSIADSFLFFLGYNFLRQMRLQRLDGKAKHLPAADELSIGFAAGAFSKLLTTPIANIVTRMQTSSGASHATASSIARQIRREKGIKGFWSGYSASLILTLNPSLTFFFFETLKRLTLPRASREHPSPATTFLLAAVSKALASTITYPFSLAKSRAQSSSASIDEPKDAATKSNSSASTHQTHATARVARKTVFSTIAEIARTDGLGALYEGLSGEVLKGFFSHGITMLVKESIHRLIIQLYYLGLKWLKRYPEAEATALRAKSAVQQGVETMKESAEAAAEATRGGAEATAAAARGSAQNATQVAREQTESAAKTAASSAQTVADAARDGASQASDAAERARQRVVQEVEAGNSTFLNVVRRVGSGDGNGEGSGGK